MTETEPRSESETPQPPAIRAGDTETPEAVRRADAILSDVGTRLGGWAARARHEAMRTVARTREELEDIWAEAQAVRHQESAEPAEGHDEARDDGPAGERHDGQAAPRRRARPRNTRLAD